MYDEAEKKDLGRKCDMNDVADFVADYITSDVRFLVIRTSVPFADLS